MSKVSEVTSKISSEIGYLVGRTPASFGQWTFTSQDRIYENEDTIHRIEPIDRCCCLCK